MPNPLETFFAEKCKEHNLTAIGVNYSPVSSRVTVYFHWLGYSTTGTPCVSAGGATAEEAARAAAIEMAEVRIPAPQLEAAS